MNPVRRPALVHPAFENTTASSDTTLHSTADRNTLPTRGSRPDTRYLA